MAQKQQQYFWLDEAFKRCEKSFDAGKLPHGLLLVAPGHSGKKILATQLAKSILCHTSTAQLNSACGQCKSCLLVEANSHPDLSEVDCLTDTKGKQKKSIGIDQIRKLTSKLVETSQLSGWRIAIIASVEKMTRGAFNAILKTLEEPGDKTLVLMLANSLQQVPATIKSRCQLLALKLIDQQLSPWLMQQSDCTESDALNALNQCHFAPFAALNYIKDDGAKLHLQLNQGLDDILSTQLTPAEFLTEFAQLDNLLWLQIAKYFQNVQLSILNSNQGAYANVPKSLATSLYFELVEYNRGQCAGSNLQNNLQLEAILIQWFELGRKIVHYSTR